MGEFYRRARLLIHKASVDIAMPAADGSVSYIIPDPLLSDSLEVFDASHRHVETYHALAYVARYSSPIAQKSPTLVAPGQSYRAGRSGRTAYSLSELGYDLPPGDFSIDAAVFASSTSGEQVFVRSILLWRNARRHARRLDSLMKARRTPGTDVNAEPKVTHPQPESPVEF